MSRKHKFAPINSGPQTHPDAQTRPVPPEFRATMSTPIPGVFACPDGPWKAKAQELKKALDQKQNDDAKRNYVRGLSDALAAAGKEPSKADAIYRYLIGG